MMSRSLRARLCTMMFLEYAIRGMWYPFLSSYLSAPRSMNGLGFTTGQVGWVLGFANALGAITAPLVAGQIADRYLNAERALGLLHLIAAVLLFLNAGSTTFWPFFGYMLLFSVAYVPTQSLTNSLALSHLEDREHTYPRTRLWGTVGWVVTGAVFTLAVMNTGERATDIGRIPDALRAAAVLAVAYAAYSFFLLPETPPAKPVEGERWAFKRAMGMLRDPSVLALTLIAIPVSTIHTAYYLNIAPYLTNVIGIQSKYLGPTIAVSQTSEVVFLFALGPLLRRFGYKTLLTVGAASQAVRFGVFALDPGAVPVILAISLHGVAFACFFTTAILYVERASPAGVRHSAQTVFGIVLFGVGPALAGPYSELFDHFTRDGRPDFRMIWSTQAAVALASAVGIVACFRDQTRSEARGEAVVRAEAAETGAEG